MNFKKITYSFLIIILMSVLSSCNCIEGEGNIELENREVTGFDRISLGMDAKVILSQDSIYRLRVDAQQNILEILETKVSGDELKIGYGMNCVSNARDITIHLSMPELRGVEVSGSGRVICARRFKTTSLDLDVSGSGKIMMEVMATDIKSDVSGSGNIDVAGKAKTIDIDISGSGGVYAYNLRTTSVKVNINGSGNAKVYPLSSLFARVSGSGSIYYKGEPEIESKISGSGQVLPKN